MNTPGHRVARIELFHVAIPTPAPFYPAWIPGMPQNENRFTLIRVTIVADAPRWDLERADRFADACADAGVAWIEEPLAMDEYDELAALTEASEVPIAGGELHGAGLPELRMMIERRCYDIFQPDAVFTGGIAQTWEVIRLCRENGLAYSPHTWTNGIGFAVNLQLMAASGFAVRHPRHRAVDAGCYAARAASRSAVHSGRPPRRIVAPLTLPKHRHPERSPRRSRGTKSKDPVAS